MTALAWTRWPRLRMVAERGEHGERLASEWHELADMLSHPVAPFLGDEQPGWSPGTFRGDLRSRHAVESLSCLALDIDGTETLEWATETLGCWAGLIHTSRSHTPESHRFRAVFPLTRPITAEEHGAIWRRLDALWPGVFDPGAKDASRFWYAPSASEHFRAIRLSGATFDPDAILGWPEPETEAMRAASSSPALASARAVGRPGDDWAAATSWRQILEPHGWTLARERGDSLHWCRPGKRGATSATTGGRGNWLYVFSSNAQPLESQKAYDKLGAFAALEHRGDLRDAVRALAAKGFGEQRKPQVATSLAPVREAPAVEQASPADARAALLARYGVATLRDLMRRVATRTRDGAQVERVTTCSPAIDKLMGGFRRGHVTVLGAETSWGKSSWAIMVCDEAIRDGKQVLIFSCEDSKDTYADRIAARRANLNATRVRDGELTELERTRLSAAADAAPDAAMVVDANGRGVEWISQAIADLVPALGTDLVVLDYLQAATVARGQQDRRNEVTYIAKTFSTAVKVAGAAGLMISQFKRLPPGQRPTMHDLKESGDIENGAEHVLLGFSREGTDGRDGRPETQRCVILDKNKNGPKSREDIFLPWDHPTASFIRVRPVEQRAEAYQPDRRTPDDY